MNCIAALFDFAASLYISGFMVRNQKMDVGVGDKTLTHYNAQNMAWTSIIERFYWWNLVFYWVAFVKLHSKTLTAITSVI